MVRSGVILAVFGALLAAPVQAQDMTVEEILNSYYEASGGLDNLKAVQSMTVTGKLTGAQGFEAPFTRYAKRPDMLRMEFTFQGITGVQAFDGETAWMLMPFMGQTEPEVMAPDMATQVKEDADIDGPLVDWEAKGHQIEFIGKDEAEGAEAYKIKLTLKNGDVTYYYMDAEYFLVITTEGKRTIQGNEMEFTTVLSDYKEVGGLMIPHSVEVRGQGPMGQTILIEQIELNSEIDDGIFAMPAGESPPQN
jgi:outer membrane lipoprotein-sorting protein